MQIIIDMLHNDVLWMFVVYFTACLVLLALFIRVDCQSNKRNIRLSYERMSGPLSKGDNIERLRELVACSVQHDIACHCFLDGKEAFMLEQGDVPQNRH